MKLTTTHKKDLDRITAPYHQKWEAGDVSDADWHLEVSVYCRHAGIEFEQAAQYLQMPGYRD